MKKEKWNDGWKLIKPGLTPMMAAMMGDAGRIPVSLPHDAMIHEDRDENTKNQHQTGFYPGGVYQYVKTFFAPAEWENEKVIIEFEAVYQHAQVYVNGDYAGGHPYGYTNFYIPLNDFLKYGGNNEIKVVADNGQEENSRWYSGSGIYRNVNILTGSLVHIPEDGVRILTPEVVENCAVVQIDIRIKNDDIRTRKTQLFTQLLGKEGSVAAEERTTVTLFPGDDVRIRQRIPVYDPILWSLENPKLYQCRISVTEGEELLDETSEFFGIRTLSLDPKNGFCLNKEPINLRGACIHHDNGIIGAATFEAAEERRCRILKEAGFNCIRSSHHPLSKAMLDACDRMGMLVLDELSDAWTRPKNNHDYAQLFPDYWKTDAAHMVAKDYNHPSVIMYVAGNEIQEASTPKGAQLCREITGYLHEQDPSRYVTVAINGLLACVDHMGEIMCSITGMTMEQMAQMMTPQAEQTGSTGVDQANGSADMMFGPLADAFAANQIVTELLDEFASVTDVTGYNYLTARHVMEQKLHPNRVILGTETLPQDMVRLWKIVKENSHVIGDMTWTGWDYLGESGIGVFYYDGRTGFSQNWPTRLAYVGDIDITGYRRPVSYYREIVYGLRKAPFIAVERLNHSGEKPNKTAWMWKDEIASWTWHGYEGKPAVVNVYSNSEEVELFLNGKSLGRRNLSEETGYYSAYEMIYEPGTLEAVSYTGGMETGRDILRTASSVVKLDVEVDAVQLAANGSDLAFIRVWLKDAEGNINMQAKEQIQVDVTGSGILQGFGNADPDALNRYDSNICETYDGSVLAVIRAGTQKDNVSICFRSENGKSVSLNLAVK